MKIKYMNIKYLSIINLIFLSVLLTCGDPPTGGGDDTSPPSVINSQPSNNTVDILVSSNIIITFSEKIDAATAISSNITITGNPTLTISVADSIITLNPQANLAYNQLYSVSINNINDQHSNSMTTAYNFSFTTEVDPATLPPVVTSTTPINNTTNIDPTAAITATFSKAMDPTTLNSSTFLINNGAISGTVIYDNALQRTQFIPDAPLPYDSAFSITITTAVQDTFGLSLTQNHNWSFSTQSLIPKVSIFSPNDSVIIDDSTSFYFLIQHPIGTESLQVFIDNIYSSTIINNSTSIEYILQNPAFTLGSIHSIYGKAFDSAGNSGNSETQTVHYLWEEVLTDGNEDFNQLQVPNDIRKLLARSTDSTLELRIEYGYNWEHPYFDTAVDLGIYLDTDLNPNTGRKDGGGVLLNGIGADHRIILGLHGGDTSLSFTNDSIWSKIYDTLGFVYHNAPQDTNFFEIGIKWFDIGNNNAVNIVLTNVFFRSIAPGDFLTDIAPDQNNGHVTILRQAKYVGQLPQPIPPQPQLVDYKQRNIVYPANPFR